MPLPCVPHREKSADTGCGRLGCTHNPCQHSINRSTHCSHHSPCFGSCSHNGTCKCHQNQAPKVAATDPSDKPRCLEKLTAPLCTARLKPTRQRTKNAICSILDQGEVCLEFVRVKGGSERVADVWRISSDGMRVCSVNFSINCSLT